MITIATTIFQNFSALTTRAHSQRMKPDIRRYLIIILSRPPAKGCRKAILLLSIAVSRGRVKHRGFYFFAITNFFIIQFGSPIN